MEKLNPFSPSKSSETPSAGFEVRRQDLPSYVRSYADNLHAQIRAIYAKYGVNTIEELRGKMEGEQIKVPLSEADHLRDLMKLLARALKERHEPIEELGEFWLDNIPRYQFVPTEEVLMEHTIGHIRGLNLLTSLKTCPMDIFDLNDEDLSLMGIQDVVMRQKVIDAMSVGKNDNRLIARLVGFHDLAGKGSDPYKSERKFRTEEIIVPFINMDYRPASLEELLAYGRDFSNIHPMKTKAFNWINAFGAIRHKFMEDRRIMSLHTRPKGYIELYPRAISADWNSLQEFLFVRPA